MNLGRDEAELTERLDERRRAADEAAQWERMQDFMVPAASSASSNPTCATFADTGSDGSESVGSHFDLAMVFSRFLLAKYSDHLQVDCVAIRFHQYVSKALPRVVE